MLSSARATAPGKVILFGEHAVVYGRPALAVPVWQVRAEAMVEATALPEVTICAEDLDQEYPLSSAPARDPLAAIARATLEHLGIGAPPPFRLTIRSTIPVARGLGSGAAVAVACARALGLAFGRPLAPEAASKLAFQIEMLHHGTPSGIDNTVIAFGRPILFRKGAGWEALSIARPFRLAIADTGVSSPTRITVGDVRKAWEANPSLLEARFDAIGDIVARARASLVEGRLEDLGELMDENHRLLQALGVSAEADDRLCRAARAAGAGGAKVSGGGRGGNIIAYLAPQHQAAVTRALYAAGARNVLVTEVS